MNLITCTVTVIIAISDNRESTCITVYKCNYMAKEITFLSGIMQHTGMSGCPTLAQRYITVFPSLVLVCGITPRAALHVRVPTIVLGVLDRLVVVEQVRPVPGVFVWVLSGPQLTFPT